MAVRSWLEKLTSPEARAALRTAAHFILDFVGDDRVPAGENGAAAHASTASDAAKVVSAVAATAGVAERLVSSARKSRSSGRRRGGKLALGLAVGAAAVAGLVYLASPKGRTKVRELWHRARGWRKPRSNGAPVEVPPPV